MSIAFLIFAVLCLGLACNVIWPRYHHPKHMVYSFLLGWPVGELALHVIAVEVLLASAFIAMVGLHSFMGAVSLVLLGFSWVLLSYHYFSAFSVLMCFSNLEGEASKHQIKSSLSLARLVRPIKALRDDDLVVDKNIVYREVDGFKLKLDIRRASRTLNKAPVLLQIHGGGWTYGYGSKNEQARPLMQSLAREGWVCVSIDYRLSPKATFPDHIIDCEHALAWVKSHIAEYGGNPDYIILTGGSAGGHLSSLLALSSGRERFDTDLEGVDLSVQGCVPFYGIYDLLDEQKLQKSVGLDIVMRKSIVKQTNAQNPELYKRMSPMSHITENAPPFMIVHGDKDSLTSFDEAMYFAQKLGETSRSPVNFFAIGGAQHAFDMFPSLRSELVLINLVGLLKAQHARNESSS